MLSWIVTAAAIGATIVFLRELIKTYSAQDKELQRIEALKKCFEVIYKNCVKKKK